MGVSGVQVVVRVVVVVVVVVVGVVVVHRDLTHLGRRRWCWVGMNLCRGFLWLNVLLSMVWWEMERRQSHKRSSARGVGVYLIYYLSHIILVDLLSFAFVARQRRAFRTASPTNEPTNKQNVCLGDLCFWVMGGFCLEIWSVGRRGRGPSLFVRTAT